jgi:hypothetical protein
MKKVGGQPNEFGIFVPGEAAKPAPAPAAAPEPEVVEVEEPGLEDAPVAEEKQEEPQPFKRKKRK